MERPREPERPLPRTFPAETPGAAPLTSHGITTPVRRAPSATQRLLRLRTFRRAALRGAFAGAAGALLLSPFGAPLAALVGAGAFALFQALAGLFECAEADWPETQRAPLRVALVAALLTWLGTALAWVEAAAVSRGGSRGLGVILSEAIVEAQQELPAIAFTATCLGLLVGQATWIRLAPERRGTRLVFWLVGPVSLLLGGSLAAIARAPDLFALVVTFLAAVPLAVLGAVAATLLAGVHAWLDRLERRHLPALPDE